MSCRTLRPLLADAALATPEAGLPAELAEHLQSCPACAAELESLRATAALLAAGRPDPSMPRDPWTRLVPALDAIDAERERRSRRWTPVAPYRLAAAVALLAIAAATAVLLRSGPPPVAAPARTTAPSLDVRLDAYLQRSTPLVVALANRSADADAGAFDAVSERRLARELARDGRELSAALRDARRTRETVLVGDLTVVFMQLGNAPSARYGASVALARHGIERSDLLFALAVRELRRSAARPAPAGTPLEETT